MPPFVPLPPKNRPPKPYHRPPKPHAPSSPGPSKPPNSPKCPSPDPTHRQHERILAYETTATPDKRKKSRKRNKSGSLGLNDTTPRTMNQVIPATVGRSPVKESRPATVEAKDENELLQKYMSIRHPSSLAKPAKSSRKASSTLPAVKAAMAARKKDREGEREREKEKEKAKENAEARIAAVQEQMTKEREEKEKQVEELQKQVEALGKEVKGYQEAEQESKKMLDEQEQLRETLKEAVSCGVCFDTLNDPHILQCGHIACKPCLQSYFRTPGAYVHDVPDHHPLPLPEELDLSHRLKVCHVCRATVTRRPARMYHLRSILELFGIDSHLPTASQATAEQQEANDPWRGSFPVEKDSYKIFDEADGVERCMECLGEIGEGVCVGCGIEFSDAGEDVWEDDELGSDDMEVLRSDIDGDDVLPLDDDPNDDSDMSADLDAAERSRFIEELDFPDRRPGRERLPARHRGAGGRPRGPEVRPRGRGHGVLSHILGAIGRAEARERGEISSSDEDQAESDVSVEPAGRVPAPQRRRLGRHEIADLEAEEDELGHVGDYPDEEEGESDVRTEESYEDSFIDDGEPEGLLAEDDEGGHGDGEHDDEMEVDDEVENDSEPDVQELRRRRLGRYDRRDAENIEGDDDEIDSVDRADSPQVRMARPSRYHRRVIEADSD